MRKDNFQKVDLNHNLTGLHFLWNSLNPLEKQHLLKLLGITINTLKSRISNPMQLRLDEVDQLIHFFGMRDGNTYTYKDFTRTYEIVEVQNA